VGRFLSDNFISRTREAFYGVTLLGIFSLSKETIINWLENLNLAINGNKYIGGVYKCCLRTKSTSFPITRHIFLSFALIEVRIWCFLHN
jgi:hypothetical protein